MNQYIKRNRRPFAAALLSVLIATAFGITLQFYKGDVLDHAIQGHAGETIRYGLLLIGFILLEILFFFLYEWTSAKYVARCTKALKADIFHSILDRDYVSFKQQQQGEYIAKYTNEADLIRDRRFKLLPVLFEILFKILFVSAALFLLDWRIALITLFLLTTPLYLPKLIEGRLQRAQAEYVQAVERNLAKVSDWLSGFEMIKNFSVERAIRARFGHTNEEVAEKLLRDTRLGVIAGLITTLISYLSYFIILAFAAYLVLAGDFTAGSFFVAIGMIDQLSYPLIALSGIIRNLVAVRPTCRKMEQFIAEARPAEAPGGSCIHMAHSIRFQDVSFAYPGGAPLLTDFNLTLERGKRYLLMGPSGCGKTTVTNLLLRYYDADSGQITVDGTPLAQYADTYSLVTVVRQDAVLFSDTLRNNLTLYEPVDDARLIALMNRLGLSKYASAEGLDGMICEGGQNLSGGEKKRICIARALLRDTEVLILDEPLANLDAATASRIEDLLLSIPEKTIWIVSHQFSEENIAKFDAVIRMG